MDKTAPSGSVRPGDGTEPRKRVASCGVAAILLCLLIPTVMGLGLAWDAVINAPWAYPLVHRSTLTGKWVGQFTTPSGDHFAVFLDIRRDPLTTGDPMTQDFRGALIAGNGSWCDNHGRYQDGIRLTGAVPMMTGYHGAADPVEIDLRSAEHPVEGLQPDIFQGKWKTDTLTLQPTFSYWNGSAFVYTGDNPDFSKKTTAIFQRADEMSFREACTVLRTSIP